MRWGAPLPRWACLLPLVAGLAAASLPLRAQGVRGSAETTVRYFEFRPVVRDTVPRSSVTERDGRFFLGDRPATCGARLCFVDRPGEVEPGGSVTQSLRATAWGFGVEGLSATVLLRSRFELGGAFVWPRSRDNFDAILAYAELVRDRVRVRAGRLLNLSGLGFTGYDGAHVRAEPLDGVRVAAYGGRSLAEALAEPRNEILIGRDDFVLDEQAWLVGGMAEAEPVPGSAATVRYQRAIWAGASGLVSERASLDLRSSLLGPVYVEGALDWDVGFDRIGKAHVRARVPLPELDLTLEGTYRHYVPYFELWTIWGFFDPTGYDEGELRVTWAPAAELALRASAGVREYADTHTDAFLVPLEDRTLRLGFGGRWRPAPGWQVDGEYRLENGFGAFLSSGQVRGGWEATERLRVWARATAFQQIEEFRVGEGAVLGAGVGGSYRLPGGLRLEGGVDLYRQTWEGRPSSVDWDQVRGWSSLRVPFGRDPGLARGGDG